MKYINYWISLFAVALLLSACSNTQNAPPQGKPNVQGGGSGQHGQSGGGRGGSGQGKGNGYYDGSFGKGGSQGNNQAGNGGANAALLNQKVIYFAYDSSQISAEGLAILAAHAHYLASHPNKRVRLEGHADERGSREYNVALSLDRAIEAERVLNNKGAKANIRTIPYGEEMPAVLGHDASAWDKNRRVEIIY
jgi:peptidoglycan-associated lipoprotein